MDKYTKALELFYSCVDARADETMANVRFNELLNHLHANFDAPGATPANVSECRAMLTRVTPKEDILCNPPKVSDAVFPIGLAKLLLTEYQLPLISGKIQQFDTFHNHYGALILQSMHQ